MSIKIIREKLESYNCRTQQEIQQAIREITQEIALMCLSRNKFFKYAAFHGGSCLRVLYGMSRFSEDLDFILLQSDRDFRWDSFLQDIASEFEIYGYKIEVVDRSELDDTVKKVFLKDDSIGKILNIRTNNQLGRLKEIKIRLEIDTNPPVGSDWEIKYLDFPLPYAVTVQDPASSFALKNHALLCRQYVKGRDWYDFTWCISRKFGINFNLLTNAINQVGPWENQNIPVDKEWYFVEMRKKIKSIDWEKAKKDIERFLRSSDLPTIELWSEDFFLNYLNKLIDYLK